MHAEIIAIGTELTTGAKLDTNSQWLSLELANAGIPVTYHSTVSDDLEAVVDSLRVAVNRSDVVLITGGLGPTLDDLTRQALAALLQTELELHEPSLEFIKSLFARHRREMPERNVIQAMFPVGSEPLPNPNGTAPGIWVEVLRKSSDAPSRVAAMPGVPGEMKPMFHRQVLPRLPQGNIVIRRARLNCFGVGESQAEQKLGDLTRRGGDPEVGITAHEATITLRITAHGSSARECDRKIDSTKAAIHERLGLLVVGEEDTELEHAVVQLLNDRGLTLCVAEAGTGGLVACRLTDADGADRCFLGGIVTGNPTAIREFLDVNPDVLKNEGPISAAGNAGPPAGRYPFPRPHVSRPDRDKDVDSRLRAKPPMAAVAGEMAVGCRARFGADLAIATSPFPDDDPRQHRHEAPSAFVALAGEGLCTVRSFTMLGNADIHKIRAAKVAMNLLRLHLLK